MYDVIIIGGGPAGVSAAVNAKIYGRNCLWLAGTKTSKKVELAEKIINYTGFPSISGRELAEAMTRHAESVGASITRGVVTGVYETDGKFSVLADGNEYEGKSVILCLGVASGKVTAGEEEFLGRGVSYCATCDGFLYKGKTIAAVCYDKHFEHEIEYLCNIAEKVYVLPLYKNCAVTCQNAEIITKAPKRYAGDMRVKSIELNDGGKLETDGVFVLKSAIAPTALVHGLEVKEGHICVDERFQTNIKGLFAAGDCTGLPYQYIKAAGDGNAAMYFCNEYLNKK